MVDATESLRFFRLTVQYDGTAFHGWQTQQDQRTVQGDIESVVSKLANSPHTVTGSGRTDAGVHANGQVASVGMPSSWVATKFKKSLNSLLPDDIWISSVTPVPPDFHPRYDALERTYRY